MSNKRLPTVTSDIPRDLRNFIDRLREVLGSSGSERFVTAQELVSTGVVVTSGTGALVNPNNVTQVSTPANPGTLTVSAAIQNIIIEWDKPTYAGHAYAEVWGNGTNNIGTAVKIGVAPGSSYVDSVGPSVSRYYWVRFINVANVEGPFNSVNGTLGETGPAVDYLLETLTGRITASQLYTDLSARIDLIDGSGAGSVNARIATETTNRTTADSALSSSITTLTATVGTNTTAIQTEASTRASETGDLFSKYTVKIDTNGYVSGFGLASSANNATPYSSFIIRADNFSVASPSGPGITPIVPFVVNTTTETVNGVSVPAGVYMDAAFIKNGTITAAKIGNAVIDNAKIVDATIQNAKIANLDAAKITTGFLSAARIQAGSLDAKIATLDAAVIGTGTINSARIGNLDAAKITTGTLSADRVSGGTLLGVSIKVGTGHSFTGAAFEVSSSGLVSADNLFGGISLFDNTYNNANPVYATTAGQRAYEAINGVVQNGNASSAAHGVRGVNYTKGTSGIVGCANNFDFYADGSGTNYGPFTGTHDSLVLKDATFTVGDIVVDKLIFERNGISSTIAEVELTSVENQKNVVGVVCTEPTPLIDHNPAVFIEAQSEESYLGEDEQTHRRSKNVLKSSYETACAVYNHMAINALGEGQVNVCGAGGDIEAGDLISSSAIPGKGMKQADGLVRNITVAKARESVTFSSPSEVKQIACIYMCG